MEDKVKKYKPVTPGRRGYVSVRRSDLYKGDPYKSLVVPKVNSNGRNNKGRITVRRRGGGHKQNYRIIDWQRNKDNIMAKVVRVEYDPNRSSYIALVQYLDGERRYIILPESLNVGDFIQSGNNVPISIGNCLPLSNIPTGSFVHCVEMKPKKGAQLVRSAGCYAQLLSFTDNYAVLRLKSGELRKILSSCRATIGIVGHSLHNVRKIGKAGRNRWLNKRPTVRGVAMNPVDHPLGGGEGKTSGGRHPCSPQGLVDGKKTRKVRKLSSYYIVKKRS